MTDKELTDRLRRALAASTALPEDAQERTVQQCRRQRPPRSGVRLRELIRCELRMLSWKFWAAEGFAALTLYAVCLELFGRDLAWTPGHLLFLLSGIAGVVSMLGLPFFLRAEQYQMREIEQATCAGLFRPAAVRFLLLFAGEAAMLWLLAVWVSGLFPWRLPQLLALLAVPFLVANNELLWLMRRELWSRLLGLAGVLFSGQLGLVWKLSRLLPMPSETQLTVLAVVLAAGLAAQCVKLAGRKTA